jgi:hypothetical protein
MSNQFEAFEDLTRYPVDEEKRERMFAEQLECVVAWSTREGWPVGVTHWFVWRDGRFWVTVATVRKRIAALRARPQSCVVVSSAGTSLGRAQTVTAKTLATVHDDAETKAWFFRALADKAYPDDDVYRDFFHAMLHGTDRFVVELEPVQWISYDSLKMAAVVRGEDDPEPI